MTEHEKRFPPPLTSEDVRTILREELEKWPNVGMQKHTEHHEWLEAQIEKEQAQRDVYLGIAKAVAQWSVVGICGFVWAWLSHHSPLKP